MPDLDTQRAVFETETYWFGGPLGAPKVYDSGTNFHASPNLRGVADRGGRPRRQDDSPGRTVTYSSVDGGVVIAVDEA